MSQRVSIQSIAVTRLVVVVVALPSARLLHVIQLLPYPPTPTILSLSDFLLLVERPFPDYTSNRGIPL